jgi:hypothetical protein
MPSHDGDGLCHARFRTRVHDDAVVVQQFRNWTFHVRRTQRQKGTAMGSKTLSDDALVLSERGQERFQSEANDLVTERKEKSAFINH